MSEIDGFFNAAFGDDAMDSHTHGDRNTAVGVGTLGQLAKAEQVKPPTMTRLVDALEQDGFVKRITDASDGRVTIISATKKGEALMWLGRSRRVESLAARLDKLSTKELSDLDRAAAMVERVARSEPA